MATQTTRVTPSALASAKMRLPGSRDFEKGMTDLKIEMSPEEVETVNSAMRGISYFCQFSFYEGFCRGD